MHLPVVPVQAHHPVVPALVQVPLQAVSAHTQAVQALVAASVLHRTVQAQVHPRVVQAQAQVPAQAKWPIRHRQKAKINEFLNII